MERWLEIDRFREVQNILSETQSRAGGVICGSVLVCVSVDRLCPCTSAELFAFHYKQCKIYSPLAADAQTQQGFIDGRAPLHSPTAADHDLPLRTRMKMSETTKCQSRYK